MAEVVQVGQRGGAQAVAARSEGAWWWGSTCNGPVHLRNKAAQACVAFDE
ncbi:hypothetical protein [Streptomyces sp. NPDC054794]